MKPSRASQIAIDALIRAATSPTGDVKYFKASLEKHIAKLERSVTSAMAAQAHAAAVNTKNRRMRRVAQENQDVHIALLMKGRRSGNG
jgi:hypothetical protein